MGRLRLKIQLRFYPETMTLALAALYDEVFYQPSSIYEMTKGISLKPLNF